MIEDVRATLMPGVAVTPEPWLLARLGAGMRSVCMFNEPLVGPAALREGADAVRAALPDVVVAIDEEGGDVTRVHAATGSPVPGGAVLGIVDDAEWTTRVARRVGEDVRRVGATLAFGPVADVNVDARNPVIGVRSLGADAASVARHTAAWVRGAQSAGVAACAKHFPGHGDTAVDSHRALPVVHASEHVLRARELVPFRAAIDAGVAAIMTSHIVVPALDRRPATFSRPILRGLLRDELGFEGVIVSDALDMAGASAETGIPEAAVRALAAGCDLLCLGSGTSEALLDAVEHAIVAAVEEGKLDTDALRASAARVRALPSPAPLPLEAGMGAVDERDVARIAGAIAPSAHTRAWLAEHAGARMLRIDAAPNIAAGAVPWCPVAAEPVTADAVGAVPPGPVVVLGRSLHRHREALAIVEALRAEHAVLVVDLGWADAGDDLVDVRAYGASRATGVAVAHLLGRDALDAAATGARGPAAGAAATEPRGATS